MSQFLSRLQALISIGDVRASEHGYDKLSSIGLTFREIITGVPGAVVVEEYPTFPKGPCILLLQKDRNHQPVHAVWGIPKNYDRPVILVTAYRPDPQRWYEDFLRRRT